MVTWPLCTGAANLTLVFKAKLKRNVFDKTTTFLCTIHKTVDRTQQMKDLPIEILPGPLGQE